MSKSEIKRVEVLRPDLVQEIRNETLEDAACFVDEWTKTRHILMYAGEISKAELRVVKACAQAVARILREIKGNI